MPLAHSLVLPISKSITSQPSPIENGGIRLKKPVRDAINDPTLSVFIRSSRVKYHVHLVLRILASYGFLELAHSGSRPRGKLNHDAPRMGIPDRDE